jgi:hypothetical protein
MVTAVKPNLLRTIGAEKGLDPYINDSSRHKMKNNIQAKT